ncbi:hypothetical protein LSCM1_03109 [Leishmania martiniquensis]|uniref:Endonuclease/exonuclease/phosphatase-like protein n=1 Tax=Leishmania martiniquensis TaxID=1580590 RepID=A0A836GIH1_9TRYP|nr:hypothetical protein LSCM1_03109 [Leishmania martiniquensis]
MLRSEGEAAGSRGTAGDADSGGHQERVLTSPESSAPSWATVPRSRNMCSLVAATPDVNVSDCQPLPAPRTTTTCHLTASTIVGVPLHRVSASDLLSLADTRNSQSGANASVVSEDHPLPLLTSLPFSTAPRVIKSAGNTGAGVDSGTGVSGAATTGAATTTNSISRATSFAGRSMTLLERRNNRERSVLSLSCLSGLNVEKLQESMRDTSLVLDSQAPVPVPQGWSNTVASAALLSDYAMPSVHAPPSGAIHSTPVPKAPPATCQPQSQTLQLHSSGDDDSGSHHSRPTSTSDSRAVDTIPGALKVIGYNILASRLASTDLYPSCPPMALSEEYRLSLIKEELRRVDPDILLLEEISVAVHERTLGPYLRSVLGMEGHHVVITDRDGNPRCAPLTQATKTAAELSSGLAMPLGVSCGTERRPKSASITATVAGMAACNGSSSARLGAAGDATKRPTDAGKGNFSPHLPQLAERCSSGRSSRLDSSARVSRFPAYSCSTPPNQQKGEDESLLLHPQQARSPQEDSSGSSLEDTPISTKATANECAMQRSSSTSKPTKDAAARAIRQTSSRLPLRPAAPTPTNGSAAQPTALPPDKATEETLSHRRVEMDGVSIFYKAARFRLLEVMPVLFNRLAAAEKRLTRYEHEKLQVNSHNVALVLVLQDMQVIGVSRIYVVAAVHLIWQRVNAQLWQAHQLLRVMEELKLKYSKGYVDPIYPSHRGSVAYDGAATQPPSMIDTPLNREGARRCVHDDAASQPPLPTALPLQVPRTPSARRQSAIPSRTTTNASDPAGESGGSSFLNVITDRRHGRYASVCSGAPSSSTTAVTCIIGGDFNSERSGPVMGYLCTGRVPRGAEVMEYWRAPRSESPVQLDHTDERYTGGATSREAANALLPTPPLPPAMPPPVLCGVQSAARQELISYSLRNSMHSSLSSIDSLPLMRPRRATQSPPPDAEGLSASAAPRGPGTGEGLSSLHPHTPLSKRPSHLYPTRLPDGVQSPRSGAADPPQRRRDISTDIPVTTPRSARRSGGAPSRQSVPGAAPRLSRGPASATPSSATSSLIDMSCRSGDDHGGCGGGSSLSVVAATASTHVRGTIPASLACRRSSDSQPPLPLPLLSMNRAAAKVNASPALARRASSSPERQKRESVVRPANQRSYVRRRTSPDIDTIDSSVLEHYGSHTVSESGSMLSAALAMSNAMRLTLQTGNDTPSLEPGECDWEDVEGRGRTPISRQVTSGTFSRPPSPSERHVARRGSSAEALANAEGNTKRRHRHHLLAPRADADSAGVGSGSGGSADLNLGLTGETRSSFQGDLASPACPRSRPVRRQAGAAFSIAAPVSTSPEAVRHVPSPAQPQPLSEAEYDATSSNASVSPPPASFMRLPKLISYINGTPSSPPVSLIDDVAHTIHLSDAYAPYCYRHPSCVSAVNPSTNMEGKVLDHILYEDEHVVCGGVLRLGELQELPNARVPSDHYMIGSVLIPIQELHRA